MDGDRLGAYALRAELGSGGMGTVHLAEVVEPVAGLEPGARVALKIVHPHLRAAPGFLQRFEREADLGRRVLHPNVIRTFDASAADLGGRPVPYLVMEYVEGRSLRTLLEELGRLPEALLREIARQVAAGLAAIHARGVIHRDLKPENILVTDRHEVRIMDLGVARLAQPAAAPGEQGEYAGSLLYSAPEQLGAGTVTPAADLYSLGVVLHELASGVHPFRRDTAEGVVQAQLGFVPAPLTASGCDVSPFLTELVATLLAKRPEERMPGAAQLHAVLERGEASDWWQERERHRRDCCPLLPRIGVTRETRLHGRARELATLRRAWRAASGGQGGVVLIEGEVGIGKTRLVDAFVEEFAADDCHVLYGSYAPGWGRGGLAEAILKRFGTAHLADALRPYLGRARGLTDAFAALLRRDPGAPGVAPLGREALHTACFELVRSLAAERPLLWIVDDLHFAEPESRRILLTLARAAEGHRALVLAATRPGLPADERAALGRLPGFRRIVPARLTEEEVVDLLRDVLADAPLARTVGRHVALRSDGIPFHVFGILENLRGRGLLELRDDGRPVAGEGVGTGEVPEAVRHGIEARLSGLDRRKRDILDVAAVSGFEFEAGLVARALERSRVAVLGDLAELERRGVVRSRGPLLRFDHHLIREELVRQLPPGLAAEYHTMLAEACTATGRATGGVLAVRVASHHLEGVRPAEGLPYLEAALDHLERSYRNAAALDLLDRALALEAPVPARQRIEWLLRKASRLDFLGRREEQEAVLHEALALAREQGDERVVARCELGLGGYLLQVARYEEARPAVERARAGARRTGEVKLETHATRILGQISLPQGRYEEARGHFEQALALARRLGDRFEECAAIGGLGSTCVSLDRGDDARRFLEQALALARGIGERKFEAAAIGNLGNLCGWQGRYAEARRHLDEAIALARTIGDRKLETSATLNLGVMFYSQGRYDEAAERYAEHRLLAREIGDRRGEALAEGNLGGLLTARGRWGDALPHLERQVRLGRELGDREAEALGLFCVGSLQCSLGRVEAAEANLRAALRLGRAIGYHHGEGYALQALAALADERGSHGDAAAMLDELVALRERTGHRHGLAEALLALGEHHLDVDDPERARAPLERALALARELRVPEGELSALARLATLPGGDPGAVRDRLRASGARMDAGARMAAHYLLWKATGDRADLAEAWRTLEALRAAAPPACRSSMVERVPLHRAIARAHASA